VFAAPVDAEVAAFVGVENRLPGRLLGVRDGLGVVDVDGHRIEVVTELAPGRWVLCCLRPEDVTLQVVGRLSPAAPMTSARNLLTGVVTKLVTKGAFVHVSVDCSVDCGATLVAAVTKVSVLEMGLRAGDTVEASFKATAVHLIGLPE
jgi:tungstate transport system ATP-binding protein